MDAGAALSFEQKVAKDAKGRSLARSLCALRALLFKKEGRLTSFDLLGLLPASLHKGFHQGHDPLVRVFHDVVAAVRESVYLGLWPVFHKTFEALRAEAPVLHAPDQL